MDRLDKMKEKLYSVREEIDKRTERFNSTIKDLKEKEATLSREIEVEEGKIAIKEKEELNVLLSECGYSTEELRRMLGQMKSTGSVTMNKKTLNINPVHGEQNEKMSEEN